MSLMKQRKFIASGLCVYNCILVTHEKLLDNDENRGETCEKLISISKFCKILSLICRRGLAEFHVSHFFEK